MFTAEITNKLEKVPDGQTEKSFITSKINQINRVIEMFNIILDDVECFEEDTQVSIYQTDMLLSALLLRMEVLNK